MATKLNLSYQDDHQHLALLSNLPDHLRHATMSTKPDMVISIPLDPNGFVLFSIYSNGIIIEHTPGYKDYQFWLWNLRRLTLSQVPSILANHLVKTSSTQAT